MTFETFKIVYLSISLLGATGAFLLLRKRKDDLMLLFLMSFTFAIFLVAFYFDIKEGNVHNGEMMKYLLRGFVQN